MRTFKSGATRDDADNKPDYEGFMSPEVTRMFGEYMHRHRKQADGKLRESDNWQKGIPLDAYIKSMFRHFVDLWAAHRAGVVDLEALMALKFNVDGYAFEVSQGVMPTGGPARKNDVKLLPAA